VTDADFMTRDGLFDLLGWSLPHAVLGLRISTAGTLWWGDGEKNQYLSISGNRSAHLP
jgi:hypothetical protein